MLTKTIISMASLLSIASFAGETIIFNEQFSSPKWKSNWKFHWDNNTGKQGDYFFKYLSEKKLDAKIEKGCIEAIQSSQSSPALALINKTDDAEELIVEFKFAMIGYYNASRFGIKLYSSSTGATLLATIGAGSKKKNYVSLAAFLKKTPLTNLTNTSIKAVSHAETFQFPIPTFKWHKGTLTYTKEGTASLAIDGKQLLEIKIDSPKFKNAAFNHILFGGNVYPQTKSRPIFSSIKIIKIND